MYKRANVEETRATATNLLQNEPTNNTTTTRYVTLNLDSSMRLILSGRLVLGANQDAKSQESRGKATCIVRKTPYLLRHDIMIPVVKPQVYTEGRKANFPLPPVSRNRVATL